MKTMYRSLALAGCSALLVTTAMPSLAQSTAEMLETAEQACLEKAVLSQKLRNVRLGI